MSALFFGSRNESKGSRRWKGRVQEVSGKGQGVEWKWSRRWLKGSRRQVEGFQKVSERGPEGAWKGSSR
jgi:hypothetical protein